MTPTMPGTFAQSLALLLVAGVWGSMLFFGTVVAPAVFRGLPPETASAFIRLLFPRYYLTLGVASGVASILLLLATPGNAAAFLPLALVSIAFLCARQIMLPHVNVLRDAALAGDAEADRRFRRWHRISVWLNGLQLLVVLYVLLILAR